MLRIMLPRCCGVITLFAENHLIKCFKNHSNAVKKYRKHATLVHCNAVSLPTCQVYVVPKALNWAFVATCTGHVDRVNGTRFSVSKAGTVGF